MPSGRTSWLRRLSYLLLPWLWKRCPAGNYHPRHDRVCGCRANGWPDAKPVEDWHGGLMLFRDGSEWVPWRRPPEPAPAPRPAPAAGKE